MPPAHSDQRSASPSALDTGADRAKPRFSKAQRRLLAVSTGLGVAVLAGAAFVLSYEDLRVLALEGQAARRWAPAYPVMVDALITVTILALVVARHARWWSRWPRWILLTVLVSGLAAASVQRALKTYEPLPDEPLKAGVAVAPYIMLLIAAWLWLAMFRHMHRARAARSAASAEPAAVPGTGPVPAMAADLRAPDQTVPDRLSPEQTIPDRPSQDRLATDLRAPTPEPGAITIPHAQRPGHDDLVPGLRPVLLHPEAPALRYPEPGEPPEHTEHTQHAEPVKTPVDAGDTHGAAAGQREGTGHLEGAPAAAAERPGVSESGPEPLSARPRRRAAEPWLGVAEPEQESSAAHVTATPGEAGAGGAGTGGADRPAATGAEDAASRATAHGTAGEPGTEPARATDEPEATSRPPAGREAPAAPAAVATPSPSPSPSPAAAAAAAAAAVPEPEREEAPAPEREAEPAPPRSEAVVEEEKEPARAAEPVVRAPYSLPTDVRLVGRSPRPQPSFAATTQPDLVIPAIVEAEEDAADAEAGIAADRAEDPDAGDDDELSSRGRHRTTEPASAGTPAPPAAAPADAAAADAATGGTGGTGDSAPSAEAAGKPAAAEPTVQEPATEVPAAETSADESVAQEPTAQEPTAQEPAAETAADDADQWSALSADEAHRLARDPEAFSGDPFFDEAAEEDLDWTPPSSKFRSSPTPPSDRR